MEYKLTLKAEIQCIIDQWINSNDSREILFNQIMRPIAKRANNIDVGEMIKCLMWDADKRKSLSYGDISEYIENKIVEEFK